MDILQGIPQLKTVQQLTLENEELMKEIQTICNRIIRAATQGYFSVELYKSDFAHFRTIISLLTLNGYTVNAYGLTLTIDWAPTQNNN